MKCFRSRFEPKPAPWRRIVGVNWWVVPQKRSIRSRCLSSVENFRPRNDSREPAEEVMAGLRAAPPGMAESIGLRGSSRFGEARSGRGTLQRGRRTGRGSRSMAIRITREKRFQQHADRLPTLCIDWPLTASACSNGRCGRRASTGFDRFKLPRRRSRDKPFGGAHTRHRIPSRTANCAVEPYASGGLRSIIYANVRRPQWASNAARVSRGAIAKLRINLTPSKTRCRLRYEDMIVNWEQVLRGTKVSGMNAG